MKRKSTINKKIISIIVGLIVIVAGVGFVAYDRLALNRKDNSSSEQITENSINLSPPTEEEINETEEHKKNLSSERKNPGRNSQEPSSVTPIITSADQTTVRAYVSGISEDGGVCTATFSKGATSFSKQSTGFRDVNTTVCEPLHIERSEFSGGGEWTVVVSYKSSLVQGKSQEVKINVD